MTYFIPAMSQGKVIGIQIAILLADAPRVPIFWLNRRTEYGTGCTSKGRCADQNFFGLAWFGREDEIHSTYCSCILGLP